MKQRPNPTLIVEFCRNKTIRLTEIVEDSTNIYLEQSYLIDFKIGMSHLHDSLELVH